MVDYTYQEGDEIVSKELGIIKQLMNDAKIEMEEYAKGSTLSYGIQANEKLWGALAHCIRLNQHVLGYEMPKSHDDNIIYMAKFANTKELKSMRKRANLLHERFYTGKFELSDLRRDYDYVNEKVNEFIRKLRMVQR
jgi:hypothetical protein